MSSAEPKIVVIGAGSLFFGRQAIWQTAQSPHLNKGTLALVDTDPDKLDKLRKLAEWVVQETGVTLKIGEGLERLAPNGSERFGERPRWYLYAAGSGRAVGYNFARTRDGDYARSGYTQDRGSFLGDASVGLAYRKGAMQTSVGVIYREIDAGKGLRGMNGLDTDLDEGLVAFQLSIRPGR